jgi:hypothetical protein
VLMEMSGKVLVMRRSVTVGTSGPRILRAR